MAPRAEANVVYGAGVDLSTLFGVTAVVAFVLGLLSFVVTHRHDEPPALHPRPAPAPRVPA